MDVIRKNNIRAWLSDWVTLNEFITTFTPEEVLYALEIENEREDGPRETYVKRLRQRYQSARGEEIKKELDGYEYEREN